MKRKITLIFTLCIVFFTACSSRPVDKDNKNIAKEITQSKIAGCDVYYNINSNMTDYLKIDKARYTDVVYAAASVARSICHSGENTFYTVTNESKKSDSSFLTSLIGDETAYSEEHHNALKPALSKLADDKISLIVTDLQSDLYDYSAVSELFVKNVLNKDLSIGFIGVQLDIDDSNARTFFIIAIADSTNLSKYIQSFKENPTITEYSGQTKDFQEDTVEMINYQIIAKESGIHGIKYDQIEFIENGYYTPANGKTVQEKNGSFTIPNLTYTAEKMVNDIEGTVNFTPNAQRLVNMKTQKGVGESVYLAAKSLVYEKKNNDTGEEIAGKVKLKIPFNVISGVKLSKISCSIDTKIYESKSSGFTKEPVETEIEVTMARGATPEQGKWRVDNKTNSIVLNILVPNAGDFVSEGKVLKLDVTFKHKDTIDSVSQWVKNWDSRGCKNILNLFNSLYTYQKDANKANNTLTVYLAPGEKKFTERLNHTKEGK